MLFMPYMAQRFRSRQTPVSTSMPSRSSGHRAQLGGARPAREAALRKRLPSPLEKRCFSSAPQTGQPAFWQGVLAIHGAMLLVSTSPSLAILGKPFGPRKAMLFVCFADRTSPMSRTPAELHPASRRFALCLPSVIQRGANQSLTGQLASQTSGSRWRWFGGRSLPRRGRCGRRLVRARRGGISARCGGRRV